ncbi:putative trafficking protein particle complex subunit 10 [Elsinoe australis]|uniref:Putative trafficking protein particle complex subunit 10 n=1 Tax=Elsinoe australis TaxID=40998 RepID=A0A4U7B8Q8_9PEZI|nr:putative trafficking protein particle complex subunit 10 [Elsinoe australis]
MERSSSSKVTVEYHDPSGVFSLLQSELETRLPLRNLNWKSPSRPLRNIDALHVEFVPDAATSSGSSSASASIQRSTSVRSARKQSGDLWGGSRPAGHRSVSQPVGDSPVKERRHQIPGLRETPYLKLFILRCDDKEAYKAVHRQQLKDWVKRTSPLVQSTSALNKHDNHDASEWMIIHVVIPDTQAASEPRWTAAKNDPDELAERSKGKTKWTGKGTTTVFDKVRADFFPSSKSALERVAQIRLPKNVVPPTFLPKVPVQSQLSESSQEQENAWQDLIAKFKTQILQSFDLRVAQFEEDIREREAQRALPGWNFCTFFTLKEGLARGFESVGLVEDALAIYDELAAGLDATTNNNTAFLGDMAALRRELMNLSSLGGKTDSDAHSRILELLDLPLDISRKDYRNLIVSSTISLFDFHTYIFARQRLLIYRLGSFEPQDAPPESAKTPQSASTEKPEKVKSDEQLLHVAEVCRRASAFVSSNTRTLRKEMETTSGLIDHSRYDAIVQSVAASWAYTTSDKVLAETSVSLIYSPGAGAETPVDPGFNFPQGANSYPTRRSSLKTVPPTPKSGVVVYENEKYALSSDDGPVKPATAGSGLAELAASRGELCLLQRRFLESLALRKDWRAGWTAFGRSSTAGDLITHEEGEPQKGDHLSFLNSEILDALQSVEAFRTAYENVTDLAIRHLMLGSRTAAVENLLGDLALLKYQAGDYTGAAQIFQKLVSKYTSRNWSAIESEMLQVYLQCLKILNRKDEYVRMTISLLRKASQRGPTTKGLSDRPSDNTTSLRELVEFSKEGSATFKASFDDLFSNLHVISEIKQFDDRDGFSLDLTFTSKLEEEINIEAIKLKLGSTSGPLQELILETQSSQTVSGGQIHTEVFTTASALGLFSVQQIMVEMGKLLFVHTYEPKQKQTPFGFAERAITKSNMELTGPVVMVYPRAEALAMRIKVCPDIHIDKQRSLYVEIDAGSLDSDEIILRLKPGTAGLRLHPQDATVVQPGNATLSIGSSNAISFTIPANSSLTIKVPYTLEIPRTDLSVKAEAVCTRSGQTYSFFVEDEISTDLLLDVDVNDIFKPVDLFSRFSIRTTDSEPLILHSVDIKSTKAYMVAALPCSPDMPVFEKQPVSLACRIRKNQTGTSKTSANNDSALELVVAYSSLAAVVTDQIAQLLDASLKESELAPFRRLILYIFKRLFTEHLEPKSLEDTILLQEFLLPSYTTFGWDTYLPALPSSTRNILNTNLQSFHATNTKIPITTTSLPQTYRRHLTIPVDVPTISLLATARLALDNSTSPSPRLPPLAIVGQSLPTTLHISYTTQWSALTTPPPPTQTLTFAIPDSPDSWLLAGPSTATFTAKEGEDTRFLLLLIPLVPGTLTLPNVEVHIARPTNGAEDTPVPTPVSAAPSSASVRTVLDTSLLSPRSTGASLGGSPGARSGTEMMGLRSPGLRSPGLVSPGIASPGLGQDGTGSYACETNCESAGVTVLVVRPPGKVEVSVTEGASTSYHGGGGSPTLGTGLGVEIGQEGRGRLGSVDILGMGVGKVKG